jgi:protein TonB
MKNILALTSAFFLSLTLSAQQTPPLNPPAESSPNPIYMAMDVDKAPAFPGGQEAQNQFMVKNIKYPAEARNRGIQGVVVISFIVEKDGKITNITVLRNPGGGTAEEAQRLVSAMPNWEPGLKNGQPVRVRMQLPVTFRLR